MEKTKRIFAVMLAAVMVCSFASCRKNNSSEGESDDSTSGTFSGSYSSDLSVSSEGEVIGGDGTIIGGSSASGTASTPTGGKGNTAGGEVQVDTNQQTNLEYKPDTGIDTAQEKMFAEKLQGTKVTIATNSTVPTDEDINIAKACKQKYGMDVELIGLPWEDMQANIASLVAGGTAPDVCSFSEVLALRYAYGNIAQPIDRYLDKSDPVWTKNSALDRFTYNGKCYGAADFDYDVFMVYYNKTLFNEQNVKEPIDYYNEGKWTFDAFRKVAKDITLHEADGTTVKTFGVATWNYPVFMQANGCQGITCSNGKWSVSVSDPAAMQGMQLMHDLSADGSFLMSDGYAEFLSRNIAMTIERPGNAIGNYDYYHTMDDEIGMVPLPVSSSGKYYAPVVSNARFITSSAHNPLGGVAYMYERRIYDMQKSTNTNAAYLAERRKTISDEHLALYNDYMAKATVVSSTMDGLANWWDGALNRNQVWNKILIDGVQPSQAIDSINGLMLDSLKKTVGSSNVKK